MSQANLKPTRSAPRLKTVEAPQQNASEKVIFGDPAVLYPVGIRTVQGKYFTVESFGDQLNANGIALRTKQVFIIETDGSGKFAFKTHKGKYLTADHKEVNANAPKTGENEWFYLIYNDGVAYFYTSDGKYLCVDDNGNVKLTANPDSPNAEFEIQINYHPQICLLTQKRYMAVLPNGEVLSNRDNQFGRDTMLTREEGAQRGTYALRAASQKYINVDGEKVVANTNQVTTTNALFCFEFHGNNLAIKNLGTGKYLTVHGTGLKVQRTSVTMKEIFVLVDSDAQITLKAANGKYVGFQGANLMTTKTSISNDEILILESEKDKWAFRTHQNIYWSIKQDGTLAVDGKSRGPSELFTLEYQGAKTIIRAPNGKYISAKPLGGLEAKSSDTNPQTLFEVYFLNRPQLVLMTNQQSFVGTQDGKVRTNKAVGEPWTVDFHEGRYALRNDQGHYLAEGPDAKIGLAEKPDWFYFEYKNGMLSIRTEKGKYLRSENQGWLLAVADKAEATELYEF